ncbi:acyltransferase [Novosphingobium sp. P6W]|nr:acyltransferase [Novosphingobium sp. P6W]KIS33686.1 hypothetical protein TQ38_02925 [Novosphingobium sp. P6W]
MRGNVLSRNLSVFLDLLRLFAALLVFVGHTGAVYSLNMPVIVAHSAKEGVAIFFVLSGFVIAFVTECKEHDWRSFAHARAIRMYSVLPVAIVVLVVCHTIGAAVNPALYDVGDVSDQTLRNTLGGALIGEAPGWQPILHYLTFTNEFWFDRVVVSTGTPFWSLGFEMAYYVAFAILFYVRGPRRWLLAAVWLVACGPRIAVAFVLWLVGVGAWSFVRRCPRIDAFAGWALLSALALAMLAWRRWGGELAVPLFEWPAPALLGASMAYYLVLALLLAAIIVVFAACTSERSIWPVGVERIVRYCAGASFTLYIAHLPVLVLIAAIRPDGLGTNSGGLLAGSITVGVVFILAELGERRKAIYIQIFAKVLNYSVKFKNYAIDAID